MIKRVGDFVSVYGLSKTLVVLINKDITLELQRFEVFSLSRIMQIGNLKNANRVNGTMILQSKADCKLF